MSPAGAIHRRELTAAEIDHALRQAAPPIDPLPHLLRIELHQQLRAARADDGCPIVAGVPGGVETEPGAPGDADPLARDHTKDHGTGREAWPVDDHAFARVAQGR